MYERIPSKRRNNMYHRTRVQNSSIIVNLYTNYQGFQCGCLREIYQISPLFYRGLSTPTFLQSRRTSLVCLSILLKFPISDKLTFNDTAHVFYLAPNGYQWLPTRPYSYGIMAAMVEWFVSISSRLFSDISVFLLFFFLKIFAPVFICTCASSYDLQISLNHSVNSVSLWKMEQTTKVSTLTIIVYNNAVCWLVCLYVISLGNKIFFQLVL